MNYFSIRRHLLGRLMLPVAVALLAGCATQPGSDADQAALVQRATSYWEAVKANDLAKAWSYELASKTGTATLDAYLKRGGIVFDEARVHGVPKITGDEATVPVRQRFSIPMMRLHDMKTEIHDPWRRVDGVWFHAPQPNPLFQRKQP